MERPGTSRRAAVTQLRCGVVAGALAQAGSAATSASVLVGIETALLCDCTTAPRMGVHPVSVPTHASLQGPAWNVRGRRTAPAWHLPFSSSNGKADERWPQTLVSPNSSEDVKQVGF